MVKIYKSAKGKLIVYLPFDVISELGLKEEDEIDFFKMNDSSYIMAKKSDITNLILGKPQIQQQPATQKPQYSTSQQRSQPSSGPQLSDDSIKVLKKIDTLRYNERTQENVAKLLNDQEKKVLQKMIAEKYVNLFSKDSKKLYSIPKDVYDKFLMRKKPNAPAATAAPVTQQFTPKYSTTARTPPAPVPGGLDDDSVLLLEKNGFLVLQTEAEAGRVSLTLEQSIRHGQVLGTRAFNKKFYIVVRTFFDKNAGNILKKLREKNYKVADLAEELSIDEEGVRAILYLLSENGDTSEKKRDVFTIA